MPPTPSTPSPGRERRAATPTRRRLLAVSTLGWIAAGALAAVTFYEPRDAAVGPSNRPTTVSAPPPTAPLLAAHAPVRVVASPPRPKREPRPRARKPRRPFATMGRPALVRPKIAFASPLLAPRLELPRVLMPRLTTLRAAFARPRPGESVTVKLSAYCLRGRTRRGLPTRTGIIAADPRVFPLARHVELYAAGRYLGRYLVDDTGGDIKGARIDVWTPDCDDARRFGVREGVATLVAAD